jgi:hypothetical protein
MIEMAESTKTFPSNTAGQASSGTRVEHVQDARGTRVVVNLESYCGSFDVSIDSLSTCQAIYRWRPSSFA